MADYPVRGTTPWDETLKAYIDERHGVVASSYDRANTAVVLPAGVYGHLPPRVTIPPTSFDLTVEYGAWYTITTAGNGLVTYGLSDISTGSAVSEISVASEAANGRSGTFSVIGGVLAGSVHLDASPNWRVLRLMGAVFRDTSSSLAANYIASNASGGQPNNRSAYIRVRAE